MPSLEPTMDSPQNVGQGDSRDAGGYQNNLSWSSPPTPLPAETHPRRVFEKLFGQGGPSADRQAPKLNSRASLIDRVTADIKRLEVELGISNRVKVDDYLTAVRAVERRIQPAELKTDDAPRLDLDRSRVCGPTLYADHTRLMFDLQLRAMQGEFTRLFSFQWASETSPFAYPKNGVKDPHHVLSHHGNDPAKIERMAKINPFHLSLGAEFGQKLQHNPEGVGSLLDSSGLMYGSGMGNPHRHEHTELPVVIAGDRRFGL